MSSIELKMGNLFYRRAQRPDGTFVEPINPIPHLQSLYDDLKDILEHVPEDLKYLEVRIARGMIRQMHDRCKESQQKDAVRLLAQRMGWSGRGGFKSTLKTLRDHYRAEDVAYQAWSAYKKEVARHKIDDVQYFYYTHQEYLRGIEELLKTYDDEWIEHRREQTGLGRLMSDEEFRMSFGQFWKACMRLEVVRMSDIPSGMIKRLARQLYVWHHRRNMGYERVKLTTRRMPRRYREETRLTRFNGGFPVDEGEIVEQEADFYGDEDLTNMSENLLKLMQGTA